jgi:hypothetical protein
MNPFEMPSVSAGCPLGFGRSLQPLSYALSQPKEIAIVGEPEAAGPRPCWTVLLPRDTVVVKHCVRSRQLSVPEARLVHPLVQMQL